MADLERPVGDSRGDGLSLERLGAARRSLGLTRHRVASMVGVAPNTIYCWETEGQYNPSFLTVVGLSVIYGRPLHWFYPQGLPVELPEMGSPFGSRLMQSRVLSLFEVLSRGSSSLGVSLDGILGLDDDDVSHVSQGAFSPEDFLEAAAGAGAEVPPGERLLSLDRCDVISVTGDSMDPTLPDGSGILVDRGSSELRDGRVFVIRTEDGLVVKRVRFRDGSWWLHSDNSSWDPIPLGSDAAVVGEVRLSGWLV